jgi:hypothetical protein
MWWTEGLPHFLSMKGAPPPPVLCLRSGEIGRLIDTKSVRLPHAGRFAAKQAKDPALEAGTKPFREALTTSADTWQLVQREAAGNALQVDTRRGNVTRTFPLFLAVDADGCVQADVQGGVGWLPVTFTGLGSHRGYELRVGGRPFSQSVHGNDFWQTDYDPSTRRWSQTFNLPRTDRQRLRLEFGPHATNPQNRRQ